MSHVSIGVGQKNSYDSKVFTLSIGCRECSNDCYDVDRTFSEWDGKVEYEMDEEDEAFLDVSAQSVHLLANA